MFKIDKSLSRANIPKTIRFTEQLNSQLSVLAGKEGISFNELVLRCCQYALDDYEGTITPTQQEEEAND